MPLPTAAELTDPNATNTQMKQRLGQLAENVESKEGAQEKANAVLDRAKQIATEDLGTADARLLHSLQVILNAIIQFRNDYDEDLNNLNNLFSTNKELQNLNSAVHADNINRLGFGFNVLAHALQQAADDITVVSDRVTSTENSLQINISNVDNLAQNNISRLFLAIEQLVTTIAENRDEIDATITAVSVGQQQNIENILKVVLSVQQLALGVHETVAYVNQIDEREDVQKRNLMQLLAWQEMYPQLVKLHGFDPELTGAGGAPTEAENIVLFPEPNQLIRIDVSATGNLPTAKGPVLNSTTSLTIDGQVYTGFSTLEVQGSSSASFPKKNWTLAFFTDETRVDSKSIKIGYMLPHSDWVFKANFVDNTHARNVAMNRLWREMVLSRTGYPKSEPDMLNMQSGVGLGAQPTGATGHVDGYPAVMYIDGIFYGLGSLNIGKKRNNYNLKSNDQKHIQLDPNGGLNLSALPLSPLDPPSSSATGEAFEIRRPAEWGTEAQLSYERFRAFLGKSKAEMTSLGIDNYINRVNMMDYIILVQVCELWDHLHKNTLYTTLDGNVWSFMPYDLDTVWGLHFTGVYYDTDGVTELHPANRLLVPSNGSSGGWGTLSKFRQIYGSDIDARYKQLRDKEILTVENIIDICEGLTRKYPSKLFEAENTRWNTVPNGTIYQTLQQTGSLKQIHNWLSIRLPLCDAYFNYSA